MTALGMQTELRFFLAQKDFNDQFQGTVNVILLISASLGVKSFLSASVCGVYLYYNYWLHSFWLPWCSCQTGEICASMLQAECGLHSHKQVDHDTGIAD